MRGRHRGPIARTPHGRPLRLVRDAAPPGLLLLTLIAIASSPFRLVVLAVTSADHMGGLDPLGRRYVMNALGMWHHVLPGLVFLLIGLVQFMPGVRARAPRLHRWMGRVFILSGLLSGLTIYWLSLTLPAMGGLLTVVGTWAFTTWMIAALVIAYLAIRRRDVGRHRAFMIRAYAIGAGVATIRLLGILGEVGLGIDFVANFGLWLWAGMTLHVLGAELILRRRIVFGRRATA